MAITTTGTMITTTPARIHQIFNLFRNRSFDADVTMAVWNESNAAVLRVTAMTTTMATTQLGSFCSRAKKATEPSTGASGRPG
jgi:hypothetical protein